MENQSSNAGTLTKTPQSVSVKSDHQFASNVGFVCESCGEAHQSYEKRYENNIVRVDLLRQKNRN